jgi:hypothetical protein
MTNKETSNKISVVCKDGKTYRYSPEAYARKTKGRPVVRWDIRMLAERGKVSRCHAYQVIKGVRRSRHLEALLPAIRAELAAKKQDAVA